MFTPKFTLVPEQFNDDSDVTAMLSPVADININDEVLTASVPEFDPVLVYTNTIGETLSRAVSETVHD